MLGVIREQRLRQLQHRIHPCVADSVEHGAALASRLDEPAPAQAGEVIRYLRLRQRQPADKLTDTEFPLASEQVEDAQPDRIAQPSEVLRHQIRLERGCGKTERRGTDRARHGGTYIITF